MRYLWHKFDFFVEMIPATRDLPNAHGLTLVDKQKHWQHASRRGIVVAMNPNIDSEVKVGDEILFAGSAGFTMDGDILDDDFDEMGKGEGHRWLKEKEVLAIIEPVREVAHA